MQISGIVRNVKRHTVGYIIEGQEYTRLQAIRLAKRGQITGVRVCNGPNGPYLSSTTSKSLYSLPPFASTKRRRVTTAAKTATPRKSRKA